MLTIVDKKIIMLIKYIVGDIKIKMMEDLNDEKIV